MHITATPIYRKAFERYLRQGIAPEISIKAWTKAATTHETPLYIWRTAGDNKVRASHAANNGKVFAREIPPDTGNPGEAINCRCTAELYTPPSEPGLESSYLGSFAIGALLYWGIRNPQLIPIIRSIILRRARREEPRDILAPHGQPIGKQGMQPGVRIAKGGKNEAKALFEKLTKNGIPEKRGNYPGVGKRLPNGDWVGYREVSKSGSPTIDIDVKGIEFDKIHYID